MCFPSCFAFKTQAVRHRWRKARACPASGLLQDTGMAPETKPVKPNRRLLIHTPDFLQPGASLMNFILQRKGSTLAIKCLSLELTVLKLL